MKNSPRENKDIKERVKKGLDMTFEKLLKSKSINNGFFVLSRNGIIEKIRATELNK